jgi:hypothetical protein
MRSSAAFLALLSSFAFAAPASAADDVARAREAYDRGVRAHAAGDHRAASRAFAEADALAPTPASLEAALESSMRADDAALGAELVERAEGRPQDAGLVRTLETARRRFAGRAGKLRVECNNASPCVASVDGVARDAARPVYVLAGPHDVVVQRGDERFQVLVQVPADAVVPVTGPRPAAIVRDVPPEPEKPRAASGIGPGWFWATAGLTLVAGGLSVWSGIDALRLHDDYTKAGCAPGASGPKPSDCAARADDGRAAQTRTNVLFAVTGVLVVTSGVTLWLGPMSRSQAGVVASIQMP